MSKVSIIIPIFNEEKYICKCLESVSKQNYDMDKMEILVIDGMSTDNTVGVIEEFKNEHPNMDITVLENKHRFVPQAMNLGIESSHGDIIIRLDGHMYIEEDFVKKCIENLNENPDVACVGGSIITIGESFIGEAIAKATASPFGVGDAKFRYAKEKTYVDTLAFGAYRRSIFDKIGLFDEELVRNQDDELNFRLIQSGNKILMVPDIVSYYYARSSIKKLARQYFQYGLWKIKVCKKHKQVTSIRQLIPMIFVLSIVGLSALSFVSDVFKYLLGAELGLYFTLAGIFAAKTAIKNKDIRFFPALIGIFLTLHISYGLGYLRGIWLFAIRKKGSAKSDSFVKSSR